MKHLNTFENFNNSLNESISFGSYYFNKRAFDGFALPAKDQTTYAVIAHNTVKFNNEDMYLKLKSDNTMGAGFRPIVISCCEDEASCLEAYNTAVKTGSQGANVSFSYGTITPKGSNIVYQEIDGITKELK
jgi:hypothetical protein